MNRERGVSNAEGRSRSFVAALAIQGTGAGVAFLGQIVLARYLGAAAFGQVGVMVSVSVIAGLSVTLGLGVYGLRFLARIDLGSDRRQGSEYVTFSSVVTTLVGLAIATLGAVVLIYAFDAPASLAVLAACLCIATALWNLGSDIGRGIGRFIPTYGASVVLRPIVTILAVFALLSLGIGGSASIGVAVLVAGGAVAVLVQAVVIRRTVGPLRWPSWETGKGWLRAAPSFLVANAVVLVLLQTDTLVAGATLGSEALGHYVAAIKVVGILSIVTGGIATVAAPRFARVADDALALGSEVRSAARWSSLLIVIGAVALIALSPIVLGAFGPEFAVAASAMTILVVGQVVNCLLGPSGTVLVYAGFPRSATWGFLVCIPLNACLTALGAIYLGLTGAAIGSAAGQVAAGLILWRIAALRTGVNTALVGNVLIGGRGDHGAASS